MKYRIPKGCDKTIYPEIPVRRDTREKDVDSIL